PVYITENGSAWPDEVGADDAVHDSDRVAYLEAHVRAARAAIAAGAPLAGYFAWSLLDNFEWSWGYRRPLGLVYVDYQTQRRIVKDSGRRYFEIVKRNGLTD